MGKTNDRIGVQLEKKRRSFVIVDLVLLIGIILGTATSQGATLVSNLDETDSIYGAVSKTVWRATSFTTGSHAEGYSLESITAQFSVAIGNPSNFSISLNQNSSGDPGTQIETLSGDQPTEAGNHTFTSSGSILTADTKYWVVLASSDTSPNSFIAQGTNSDDQTSSDGWVIGNRGRKSSTSGASWVLQGATESGTLTGMISVEATPVPEPRHYALVIGCALVGPGLFRSSRMGLNHSFQ